MLIRNDFKCDHCGHEVELEYDNQDDKPKKCPECKKNKLVMQWPQVPVHNHYSPMHPRANRGRGH